tara:strand:- start:574 stop:2208 length:1635 start_codon:yes stop_codon:yes gene_type:complete
MFLIMACPKAPDGPPPVQNPDETTESQMNAEALQLPLAEDNDASAAVFQTTLKATNDSHIFRMGIPTQVWAFNGHIPGPLIRFKAGTQLQINFTNALELPITLAISGHGLLSPANDCTLNENALIAPGHSCLLGAPDLGPGLYYYFAAPQAEALSERGLIGPILVDAPNPDPDLPQEETFLVFDDIRLDTTTQIATFEPENPLDQWEDRLNGRLGNVLLVNGKLNPDIVWPDGKSMLLHVWNISGAQLLRLSATAHTMHQVASARGPLAGTKSWSDISLIYVTEELIDAGIFESGTVFKHGDVGVPPSVMSDSNPNHGLTLAPGQRASLVWTPTEEKSLDTHLEWHDAKNGKYHAFLNGDGGVVYKAGYGDGWRPPRYLVNTDFVKNDDPMSWHPTASFEPSPAQGGLPKIHLKITEELSDAGLVSFFKLHELEIPSTLEPGVYELWLDNHTHTEHYLQFNGATLEVQKVEDAQNTQHTIPAGNLGVVDTVLFDKAQDIGSRCRTIAQLTIHDAGVFSITSTVLSRDMSNTLSFETPASNGDAP